jgi:hypothetical protein
MKKSQDDEGGRFEQSALQQVIYVKRRTHYEEKAQENQQNSLTLP